MDRIREEGDAAHRAGEPISACPFDVGTPEALTWQQAWIQREHWIRDGDSFWGHHRPEEWKAAAADLPGPDVCPDVDEFEAWQREEARKAEYLRPADLPLTLAEVAEKFYGDAQWAAEEREQALAEAAAASKAITAHVNAVVADLTDWAQGAAAAFAGLGASLQFFDDPVVYAWYGDDDPNRLVVRSGPNRAQRRSAPKRRHPKDGRPCPRHPDQSVRAGNCPRCQRDQARQMSKGGRR